MVSLEYKNFACIKNLGKYQESFYKLVDSYGIELNSRIVLEESVYTPHDFDCHCTDIYKVISEVLLDSKRAYSGGLSDKELYILDLAVLFHDISMSRDVLAERKSHSKMSAEYVQNLYNNKESLLYKESQLNTNEIKALKAIIMAHSDVKDGSVDLEIRGLKDPNLTDNMPARSGVIRGKLLAGILRLADELDITSERLGNTNVEENLKIARAKCANMEMQISSGEGEQLREKYEKYKKYVESLAHWENLHLFSQVFRENQDDKVYLVTDDEHLQQLLDEGNTPAVLARRILKVYEKIEKEWKEIKKIVVDDSPQKLDIKSFFPVSTIEIKCSVRSILQELDKQLNNVKNVKAAIEPEGTIESTRGFLKEKIQREDESICDKGEHIQLIGDLSNKLTQEIKRRHLLKVGHFLLDDICCARDWIDIKEIVETKVIADKVIGCFIDHIRSTCDLKKKSLIVGLDLEGALLASRVAMGLKKPFSYIIPVKEHANVSSKESEISIKDYDNIILVTDAIVTFDTIKNALQEIMKENDLTEEKLMEKVTHIYTVFYRKNSLLNLGGIEELEKRSFCLNMDFPVELYKKEECHYIKEGQCLALNCQRELYNCNRFK